MLDIVIVGIVVVIAIVLLVWLVLKWTMDKRLYGNKQKELIEEVRKVEHSSLMD